MSAEAPLFTRSYDLVLWLVGRSESMRKSQRFVLAERITSQAFALIEAVTLALRGFDRADNVERADAALALLRLYLRLAVDTRLLTRRQLTFATTRMDEVGKMIGGWNKKLQ